MSLIIKGLLAGLWLLAVPAAAGILFIRKRDTYHLGTGIIAGYLFMFSVAEIVTLPMIILNLPLHMLTAVFGVIMGTAAILGLVCLVKKAGRQPAGLRKRNKISFYPCAAVALILVQVCVMVFFAHMDADDSFYVGTATTAVQTDTIFSVSPYTGAPYGHLPSRYVLSPFPVFLAVASQLCAGLHPAVMAHVVFPAVFLPFAYLVLFQLAKRWFPRERDSQGIFMVFSAVLVWFSGYSIYSGGNFQMVRIWQGKAFLAAAFIPLAFYFGLTVVLAKKPEYPWLFLGMTNVSACLLSSMGIILVPLITGIFILMGLVKFRSLERTVKGALCCLPSLLLGVVYLLIR